MVARAGRSSWTEDTKPRRKPLREEDEPGIPLNADHAPARPSASGGYAMGFRRVRSKFRYRGWVATGALSLKR